MPSPFPGMDPYLEGELWSTFHAQFVAEIARQLAPRLRPKYLALMEKRFVTYDPSAEEGVAISASGQEGGWIIPDVAVVETGGTVSGMRQSSAIAAPIQIETLMPGQVPQHWIEIRDVAERRLITVIEVLSPANKKGDGHREYLERRARLLLSSAHLLEIDLLRKGHRPPMRRNLPPFPYFVFLSRAQKRPVTDVWPIRLDTALPPVLVPLEPPDLDVELDLQRAFTSVFDQLSYDLATDYSVVPEVPLSDADAKWAVKRIAEYQREK